ncbi:unnamed protein product, partial [Musa acuminata subsp. burmannicoides]
RGRRRRRRSFWSRGRVDSAAPPLAQSAFPSTSTCDSPKSSALGTITPTPIPAPSIRERQLRQEESCWAGMEHVRRLDVEPEDRSTYRQKASGHRFGYRAKKSKNYTKEIEVADVNWSIGQ